LAGLIWLVRSFGVIKFTIDGRTYDLALPRKDRLAEKAQTTGRSHKDFLIEADPTLPVEKTWKADFAATAWLSDWLTGKSLILLMARPILSRKLSD